MIKGRLEAFSDGVIAIIITIMVLELKIPHGAAFAELRPLIPVFFSYLLSFIYVGIYWNNHHHIMHGAETVNGLILWTNLHLLFWLSLIPFATGWMGENHFAAIPVALYGGVLLMTAAAYYLFAQSLIRHHGRESLLKDAVGRDGKGLLSMLIYAIAIPLTFISAWISLICYVCVALLWFIPDRRIEEKIVDEPAGEPHEPAKA